jgi:hypothetical protein
VTTLLIKVGKNEDVEVEKFGSPKTLIIKKNKLKNILKSN